MGSRFRRGIGIATLTTLTGAMCSGAPAHAVLPSPASTAYVVSSDTFAPFLAVAPQPSSTYPPGGTSTQGTIAAGPFTSSSTLTAITAGDPVTGTSSASATVQTLSAAFGTLIGAPGLSLTGVNASCNAGPGGATGSGVISSGSVIAGIPVPLPANAAPNTVVTVPLLGTVTLNEQTTDGNGVLTVNAVHFVLLPAFNSANVIVGHVTCGGAAPGPTITKTATEKSFVPGQTIHYTYAVKNNGTDPLTNVAVTDNGPGTPTVTCPAGPLTPGSSENCTASYTATAADATAGKITNTATLTANLGEATLTSSSNTVTVPLRALTITKSAIEASFQAPGETVHYTYTVTNTGQAQLTNLAVTDLTAGVTVSGCGTDQLAPGESTTCQATYVTTAADVANKTIVDVGTATATDPGQQVVTAVSDAVTTPLVALAIAKSATESHFTAAGQTLHYSYTVTNNGAQPISGIGVQDNGPGSPTVTCPVTTLAPGASTTCTATYTTTDADVAAGKVVDTATVSGTTLSEQVITSDSKAVTVPFAGLKVVKAVQETAYSAPKQQLHYTFTVTNTGGVPLSSLSVLDAAPGSPTVTCPVTTLAPGASTTCTATYTTTDADVDAGKITDTAIVTGSTPDSATVTATSNTLTIAACTPCEDRDHGGCREEHPHGHGQDVGYYGDPGDRHEHEHGHRPGPLPMQVAGVGGELAHTGAPIVTAGFGAGILLALGALMLRSGRARTRRTVGARQDDATDS